MNAEAEQPANGIKGGFRWPGERQNKWKGIYSF